MESFAVIGLGRFGMMLARTLAKAGREVIAIDTDRDLVESIQNDVTVAVRLDATDERALKGQGVDKVSCAIVSIGESFEANVMATALLKTMGIKRVIARAATPMRQKILQHVGADEIISADRIRHFSLEERSVVTAADWLPAKRPIEIVLTCGASCPDALLDEVLLKILSLLDGAVDVERVIDQYEPPGEIAG